MVSASAQRLCLLAACFLVLYYFFGSRLDSDRVRVVPAFGHRSETTVAGSSTVNRTEWVNPGCIEKKLNRYRPMDTGRVYHYLPIVHYAKLTWSSQSVSLNFREYTSVLSVYKFLQPERIIFHINTDVVGKYWDKIKVGLI